MFLKKILKLDEATLQDHGVLPAEGGLLQSNRKSKAKSTRRGGLGPDGRGKGTGGRIDEGTEWKEIPFSWIVRGRQESHLVDQQVPHVATCEVRSMFFTPQLLRGLL